MNGNGIGADVFWGGDPALASELEKEAARASVYRQAVSGLSPSESAKLLRGAGERELPEAEMQLALDAARLTGGSPPAETSETTWGGRIIQNVGTSVSDIARGGWTLVTDVWNAIAAVPRAAGKVISGVGSTFEYLPLILVVLGLGVVAIIVFSERSR